MNTARALLAICLGLLSSAIAQTPIAPPAELPASATTPFATVVPAQSFETSATPSKLERLVRPIWASLVYLKFRLTKQPTPWYKEPWTDAAALIAFWASLATFSIGLIVLVFRRRIGFVLICASVACAIATLALLYTHLRGSPWYSYLLL